jgi:hypothetical protein
VPVWLALHAANPSDVVAANTAPPFTSSSALKVHHPIRLRNHIQVVKSAAEQVGCAVKPSHGQTLLSRRSMTSCVVPVSPILGKTRVMLWAWASPVQVGHGVGREGDVEAELIGLARRDFDAIAGGDADDYDLRDSQRSQMGFKDLSS